MIINKTGIDDVSQSIYTSVISNIQKPLGKSSGWIIGHTILLSDDLLVFQSTTL